MNKKYKRAITYGTYDVFHVGHLNLFERIKSLADELFVAVSTDEFNVIKNKCCTCTFEQRIRIISALKIVDGVIEEEDWSQKPNDIRRLGADLFVMGDDWAGKFDELRKYADVIYLPRTPGIDSTKIRNLIRAGAA